MTRMPGSLQMGVGWRQPTGGAASVGHDFSDRAECPTMGHRTSTRRESRRVDPHRTEQRHQPPGAPIFEGPLRATALATSPTAANDPPPALEQDGPATLRAPAFRLPASTRSSAAHILPPLPGRQHPHVLDGLRAEPTRAPRLRRRQPRTQAMVYTGQSFAGILE
jgi:hypothetical protein